MKTPKTLDRDLSWIYFNHRILQEAQRANVPLLERLSFLGIYSNNLDEFFRVRVSTMKRVAEYESGRSPGARRELRAINEMAMIVGLALLTAGIFFGAVWANESWGRYWGWDPKETWALITMFAYALATHSRHIPRLDGPFAFDVLSVVCFSTVLMTFFGVNYYLSGLHSYGHSGADRGLRRHSADRGGGRPIFQNLEKKMIPA